MQLQMTKILRRVKQQRAIRTATSYISMWQYADDVQLRNKTNKTLKK